MSPAQASQSSSLEKKRIVHRVLQSDPGQEYFAYVPSAGGRDARILVAIHGISRNARELVKRFSPYAEALRLVMIAPLFSAERNRDYQRLGRVRHGTRADVILESIVEEVALWAGAATDELYLFGYSGGAQFAHRYTLAHPHRVVRAVAVSAGWYTFPDPHRRFPYGIRRSKQLPQVRFDPEEFLRVPISVMVGEQDTATEGVRRSPRLDRQQGVNRVERARNWVAAMQSTANTYRMEPLVTYEQIAGGNHSFKALMETGHLGDRVFGALFGSSSATGGNHDHERRRA